MFVVNYLITVILMKFDSSLNLKLLWWLFCSAWLKIQEPKLQINCNCSSTDNRQEPGACVKTATQLFKTRDAPKPEFSGTRNKNPVWTEIFRG